MTTAVDTKNADKEAKKEAIKARSKDMDAREAAKNEGKSGIGLRTMLGLTRGKNPSEIEYEAFDDTKPETLPTSLAQFMEVSGVKEEKTILELLIDGFNSAQYTNASDPVAEFVEASWTPDAAKAFKLVVKNYANNVNVSIEDAVALIKPGFAKAQAKG